jgi:hypothetical protein
MDEKRLFGFGFGFQHQESSAERLEFALLLHTLFLLTMTFNRALAPGVVMVGQLKEWMVVLEFVRDVVYLEA